MFNMYEIIIVILILEPFLEIWFKKLQINIYFFTYYMTILFYTYFICINYVFIVYK